MSERASANTPHRRSSVTLAARALRTWQMVFAVVVLGWAVALLYTILSGRVMYGDGALYVLVHLQAPFRFNDYDFQRSFASFITQAPILFGQRVGLQDVAAYTTLYGVGMFALPAAAFVAALWISRKRAVLFSSIAVAIVLFGFGVNFINSEANLFFGLVWLAVAILGAEGGSPVLRWLALPAIGLVLLRTYEGMLLVGPILAGWAAFVAARTEVERERIGLTLAALLFLLGAVVGLGGFLSPRDPGNAANFLASTLQYFKNPQVYLLAAGLLAWASATLSSRLPARVAAVLAALCSLAFLVEIYQLKGYFSYTAYYQNRAFLTLGLPVFVALVIATLRFDPPWLRKADPCSSIGILAVPVVFAIAGDMLGTSRWSVYVREFCAVLQQPGEPQERLARLRASSVLTGWAWTHPTMSLLLRGEEGSGMVANDPGQYEPFDYRQATSIPYRGFCAFPPRPAEAMFGAPISFTGGGYPPYVKSVKGLATPEAWATWSNGPAVEIEFAKPMPASFNLKLKIGGAFGANRGQPVRVRAGNAEQSFVVDREPLETTLRFRDIAPVTTLVFLIPQPQSPTETGTGNDSRKLGIAFVSVALAPP